jgi:hypothetical protein
MTDAVTLQQEWMDTFNKLQQLSDELGVGDPFNYNRGREIHTAFTLGLTVSQTLSGADAYLNGKPVELKSTITKSIKATYNGISVQPTWDEQEDYLINDKIGKYVYHYFTRYEGSKLVEAWRMDSNTALSLLLPKLKKTYSSTLTRKDPRLNASLSKKEIEAYAERII